VPCCGLRPQSRRCAASSVGGLQRPPRIRSKKTLHRDPRIGAVYPRKRTKRTLRATPRSLRLSRCAASSVGGLQRHRRRRSKKTLHRDPRIGTVYLQKRKERPRRATPKSLRLSRGAQPQTFESCPWRARPRAERRDAPAQDRPVPQVPASLAGDDAPAARYTPQRKARTIPRN